MEANKLYDKNIQKLILQYGAEAVEQARQQAIGLNMNNIRYITALLAKYKNNHPYNFPFSNG